MHMKGMYKPGGVRKGWEEEKGGEQSLGRAFKEARRERKKKKKVGNGMMQEKNSKISFSFVTSLL